MSIIDSEKDNANSIDISNVDAFHKVTIAVSLDASVISRLRNKYPGENLNDEINFILDKMLNPTLVLNYKGNPDIRSDVLQKFKKIADAIEDASINSILNFKHVRSIVKTTLGRSDSRVIAEFIKSIESCVYFNTGKKPTSFASVDYSCFVQAVNEKLSEKYL